MEIENENWIDEIQFDSSGLIPAIAVDHETNDVLMVAWMNRESILETVRCEEATYWSRSRQVLWRKGETSGHTQKLKTLDLDCDGDVLTLKVEQVGGIACHTGRRSCFYRTLTTSGWQETEVVLKDPQEIYPDG